MNATHAHHIPHACVPIRNAVTLFGLAMRVTSSHRSFLSSPPAFRSLPLRYLSQGAGITSADTSAFFSATFDQPIYFDVEPLCQMPGGLCDDLAVLPCSDWTPAQVCVS